jgi:NADH-quinone oxidoreductase subunit C
LPTLSAIYPGADWHERETHDFFGVIFSGHPDLTPLLLPEDADFHPLRKDFAG